MAKLSDREKEAKKLGITVKELEKRKASEKSSKSSKKSGSSSSPEKKAKKKITEYYDERQGTVKEKAKVDAKRLEEDLTRILSESGIQIDRKTEDYIKNVGLLEEDKDTEIADLNEYVTTQRGRTQEDLDTSLRKEARRFAIQSERINQDLADRGMTFSDRTDEKIEQGNTAETVAGIQTTAERSFQDIQRLEVLKSRDIDTRFQREKSAEELAKDRGIEDITRDTQQKQTQINRGKEDIAFGKAQDIKELEYGKDTDVALLGQTFDKAAQDKKYQEELFNAIGA